VKQKIIYDTDAGHDDVVAWCLLQASPEFELLGVTTVFGNTSLERVYRNAQYTKNILGSTTPLLLGASEPLLRNRINAEVAHGASGLQGVTMPPEQTITEPRTAVQFMIEQVLAAPNEVTLVPVGPLTNIALAMRLEPRIIPAIKEIVLMGGSLTEGNFTPAAEFNTLADPHAAKIVFESGAKIAMFGLNVTATMYLVPDDLERVKGWPTKAGKFLGDVLTHSVVSHTEWWGYPGASMHDPCPLVYLVRPDLFEMKAMSVDVETQEGANFGRTTGDPKNMWKRPHEMKVAVDADVRGVIEFMLTRLETLP
jgi:purine nucleosidase